MCLSILNHYIIKRVFRFILSDWLIVNVNSMDRKEAKQNELSKKLFCYGSFFFVLKII